MEDIPSVVDEFDGYRFLIWFCVVITAWVSFVVNPIGASFDVGR